MNSHTLSSLAQRALENARAEAVRLDRPGSSTQVAPLVAPILVFAGLLLGRDMNLVFTPFEVMALGLSTIVTAVITLDGESHWFEGVQLLAVYGRVAVGAYFLV